jgi:hypothetical protein
VQLGIGWSAWWRPSPPGRTSRDVIVTSSAAKRGRRSDGQPVGRVTSFRRGEEAVGEPDAGYQVALAEDPARVFGLAGAQLPPADRGGER